MLDSYSLDAAAEGMEAQYRAHAEAYHRIFRRCSLPVVAVGSDSGMMGGKMAHEFMYLSDVGEDTILICPNCDYKANRQAARFRKSAAAGEELLPVEKVAARDHIHRRPGRLLKISGHAHGESGFLHGDRRGKK